MTEATADIQPLKHSRKETSGICVTSADPPSVLGHAARTESERLSCDVLLIGEMIF